jgi:hypothetical protein
MSNRRALIRIVVRGIDADVRLPLLEPLRLPLDVRAGQPLPRTIPNILKRPHSGPRVRSSISHSV